MAGVTKKPHLPKAILDMKFMKKSKERVERELQNTKDHGRLYCDIITNEMRSATGNFISETSFIFCEDLLEGRLSFKGMNPEIERLMELEKPKEESSSDMQKDVPDEVLAKKFESFNRKRKMQTEYQHNNKFSRKA